ncbi:MAG TPA: ABC transporter substrate-binding protein, partial [Acidimicrobiia bacterium]|nr:ABC transporter substrate-binding protein [Acidimicrobiia bacterium]
QFAGYYAAIDQGYYDAQCLNVEILEGGVDIVPQQVLASGGAEFGIAWVPKALVSRQAGADIINVAQVFERSGTLMVSWKDSNITSPEDWAGKKVGNWGFGNEYELLAAIEKFDVPDVELVAQDFTMSALLNREIDSAEAMTYNEYAQVLEAENPDTGELYQPEDLDVIDFNEVDTAMLQDSLWVNAEWIADNEDVAQRFLQASFEGWIYCRGNPDDCVQSVLDAGSTLGLSHQTWMMNEINALIWPASNGIGVMNDGLWDQTIEIATTQIPDLEGVEISDDVYRADLAEAAVAALEEQGLDVRGESWERIEVQLNPGGE